MKTVHILTVLALAAASFAMDALSAVDDASDYYSTGNLDSELEGQVSGELSDQLNNKLNDELDGKLKNPQTLNQANDLLQSKADARANHVPIVEVAPD